MADTTMLDMVRQTIAKQTEQANGLVEKISAATSDTGKLVHEIRTDENVTDETVKAFQDWYDKANAAIEAKVAEIDAYIKANLLPSQNLSETDVEALKEQYRELKSGIKSAMGFVATLPGYDPEKFDVPELKNLRGGTSGGNSGEGGKRPRLAAIWVNDTLIEKVTTNPKTGEDVHTSNFTLAAQAISKDSKSKVEVKDLQAAAFEAAKTDDLSTLAGTVFDFVYSSGEKNYKVKVQPAVKDATPANTESTDTTPAE